MDDLYNLSLTSRICRVEAERILYRAIDIPQNTRAPVLWANTILQHPHKAMAVHALTLRFDLSFLIVPHMLLSSLRIIAYALRALRNLRMLCLVGHPLAMMHPINLWLLDGCTPHLEVFHNSVFPPSAIFPFLSCHPNIRQWKQAGSYLGGEVERSILPQLTDLDVHASILSCFTTPRPLVRLCLKMDGLSNREREKEYETIKALRLFAPTLTSLQIEHTTASFSHLTTAEILALLAETTPNLKVLRYNTTGFNPQFYPSQHYEECLLSVLKFSKLEVLSLPFERRGRPFSAYKTGISIAKSFLQQCPSLRCLALRRTKLYSYIKCQDGTIMEGEDTSIIPCMSKDI